MVKTARDILIEGLKAMGADGLCSCGCGCGLDDLCPCGEDCTNCVPAKLVPVPEEAIEEEGYEEGDKWYEPLGGS